MRWFRIEKVPWRLNVQVLKCKKNCTEFILVLFPVLCNCGNVDNVRFLSESQRLGFLGASCQYCQQLGYCGKFSNRKSHVRKIHISDAFWEHCKFILMRLRVRMLFMGDAAERVWSFRSSETECFFPEDLDFFFETSRKHWAIRQFLKGKIFWALSSQCLSDQKVCLCKCSFHNRPKCVPVWMPLCCSWFRKKLCFRVSQFNRSSPFVNFFCDSCRCVVLRPVWTHVLSFFVADNLSSVNSRATCRVVKNKLCICLFFSSIPFVLFGGPLLVLDDPVCDELLCTNLMW